MNSPPAPASAPPPAASSSSKHLGRTPAQKLLITLGVLGVFACLAPAAVVAWGLRQYENIDRVSAVLDERVDEDDPINILIVGSDSRDGIDDNAELSEGFLDGEAPGGQRSDTLMVARLDPVGPTIDLLSFPRDLWVPVEPSGEEAKINSAYNNGPQAVIDTIQKNFLIDVNHYLEVDFAGFQDLVDSLGGVPVYFEREMADTATGFHVREPGCVNLDGSQALAFARSRKLQYIEAGQWKFDQAGDLGRIARQQFLLQKSIDRAGKQKPDSPSEILSLVNFFTQRVTIDDSLGLDDMVELANTFGSVQANALTTHSLPVANERTGTGVAIVRLIEEDAIDELAVFQGNTVSEAVQDRMVVTVLNSTQRTGLAAAVTDAYSSIGFRTSEPADGDNLIDVTRVRHAPGQRSAAELVGKHLGSGARLVTDANLSGWKVEVDLGANFTVVTEEAGDRVVAPVAPPTSAPAPAAVDGAGESAPNAPKALSARPARISPSGFGVIPFEAPANQPCA